MNVTLSALELLSGLAQLDAKFIGMQIFYSDCKNDGLKFYVIH